MYKSFFQHLQKLFTLFFILFLVGCASGGGGKGTYRVERGDTLSRIAQKNGQTILNLTRWNNLSHPDKLEVGQILRLTPPKGAMRTVASTKQSTSNSSKIKPRSPKTTSSRRSSSSTKKAITPPATNLISLIWPSSGQVIKGYGSEGNKGIDIAGKLNDPIIAAAPGEVAYIGQLRGYGNLLIVKHPGGFLTAYGHLQSTLVNEGDKVTSGQKIALMGNGESSRYQLHFELRYNGEPINPSRGTTTTIVQ